MSQDVLLLRRKNGPWACLVKGHWLAPAIWVFDNLETLKRLMAAGNVPCEEWSVDGRSGIVHVPGLGGVPVGDYIVLDDGKLHHYKTLDDISQKYDIVG